MPRHIIPRFCAFPVYALLFGILFLAIYLLVSFFPVLAFPILFGRTSIVFYDMAQYQF